MRRESGCTFHHIYELYISMSAVCLVSWSSVTVVTCWIRHRCHISVSVAPLAAKVHCLALKLLCGWSMNQKFCGWWVFFFSMVEFLLLFSSVQQVFSELMSLITYTGYFCLANTERKLQDTSFWGKMVTLYNKFPLVKVR